MGALALMLTTAIHAAVGDTFTIDQLTYTVLTEDSENAIGTVSVKAESNTISGDIIIPETVTNNDMDYTVTTLAASAFRGCKSVTSIKVPETCVDWSNEFVFYYCTSLQSLNIPSGVTSIGSRAFGNGTSVNQSLNIYITNLLDLYNMTFAHYESSPIQKYSKVFVNNEEIDLTDIVVPEGVTTLHSYLFYNRMGDTRINSISLPSTLQIIEKNSVFNESYGNTAPDKAYIADIEKWCSVSQTLFTDKIAHIYFEGQEITSLVIPDNVTQIANYAFYGIETIEEIDFNNVTNIGSRAFAGCTNLQTLNLKNVTNIGENAFANCTGLTSVTNMSNVTEIGKEVFYNCTNLSEITLSNKITTLNSNLFRGCTSLTSFTIPENVTTVNNYVFYGCSNITELTIYNTLTTLSNYAFSGIGTTNNPCLIKAPEGYNFGVDTSGAYFKWKGGYFCITVLNYGPYVINDLYYSILSLNETQKTGTVDVKANTTSISGGRVIPQTITEDGITWTVTKIDNGAFTNCTGLTSVSIPETCTSWPTNAFDGCTSLQSATLNCPLTAIPNYTFKGCTALTTVNIPGTVTSIGEQAFCDCNNLANITFPQALRSIGKNAFSNTKISSISSIPANVSIGQGAFYNCNISGNLEIPSTWTLADNVFKNNPNITKVTFLGNRTNPGGAGLFEGCTNLKQVEGISNFKYIPPYYFKGCGFTTIDIPSSCQYIGSMAFRENKKLQEVIIPDGVQYIYSGAFHKCTSLTSVEMANSVTVIGVNEDTYDPGEPERYADMGAFSYCTSLTHVTLSDNIEIIPLYTFYGCSKLESVNIPENCKIIKPNAFGYCVKITSLDLKNVEEIRWEAFAGCSIEQIKIPETCKKIGDEAFRGNKLRTIKIPNSVETMGRGVFKSNTDLTHVTMPSHLKYTYEITSYESSNGVNQTMYCPKTTEYTLPAYANNLDIGVNSGNYTSKVYVLGSKIPLDTDITQLSPGTTHNGEDIVIYVKPSVFSNLYSDGKSGYFTVDYKIPLSMTNASGNPIAYKTLCRDFDVDLTHTNDNLPEGVEPLRAYLVEDVDGDLRMVFMNEIKYIPSRLKANVTGENSKLYQGVDEYVGVILRGTPGYTYYYEIGEHDYTLGAEGQWLMDDAMEYSNGSFEQNLMAGDANDDLYVYKTVNDDDNNEIVNYGLNAGKFKIYKKDGWLSYNKSYLQLPKDVSSAIEGDTDAQGNANLTFVFENADGTTDKVSAVEFNRNSESDIFYNPYGQRVSKNTKGIVINNGKKTVNR